MTSLTEMTSSDSDQPTTVDTRALRIRRGVASDAAALIALENSVFTRDRLSARQWHYHLANPRADILVASDASAVLIGAAVVFFHARSDIARLYSLAVAPSARGLGAADALIDFAERGAMQRGCRRMRLEVRRDNVAAHRLYARRGFVVIGERAGYYEDGHDALRYEKILAARVG